MTAPERIKASGDGYPQWGVQFKCYPMPLQPMIEFGLTEYVRADLHDETKAQPAECETRLRKVVEALWEIRLEYDPSDDSLNSRTMYDIACDVLAEIEKGGV